MAAALSIAFTPTPVAASTAVIVEATPMVSAGRSFATRSQYRVISVVAAAGVSPANIITAFVAKFGALVIGKRIFLRLTPVNSTTFEKGVPVETSVVVA